MQTTESRHTLSNGRLHSRRRPPDVFEWGFAVLLLLGFVVSAAIGAALFLGAVWAAVWFVQDMARRLGG